MSDVRRLWPAASVAVALFGACNEDAAPSSAPVPTSGAGGETRGGRANASGETSASAGDAITPRGDGGAAGGSAGDGSEPAVAGAATGNAGEAGTGSEGPARVAPYPPSPYPAENPDSDAKALLGKILFWDEQLSGDDTVACGTCHRPGSGGSDPRSALAAAALPGADAKLGTADDVHGSLGLVRCNAQGVHTGSAPQVTARKAPTYLDAMLPSRLFWDGRAECSKPACPSNSAFEDPDAPGTFAIKAGGALENQVIGPPLSPVEMACEGASWSSLHQKLSKAKPLALAHAVPQDLAGFIAAQGGTYPALFQAAFGTEQTSGAADQINTRRVAFAIATHERRLRSDHTPWDRWNAGDDGALTPAQLRGLAVFNEQGRCRLCHAAPYFSDVDFHFIGFHRPAWDQGRRAIDTTYGVPGAIRTPTLRNVGLREASGLLHNGAGVGTSLAQIIDLYDLGGLQDDAEVSRVPIDATIRPLQLNAAQRADLLEFLQHGLTDPRVQAETAPFDRPLLSTE